MQFKKTKKAINMQEAIWDKRKKPQATLPNTWRPLLQKYIWFFWFMHLNFQMLPVIAYSNCSLCLKKKKVCLKTQPSSEFFHRWSLQKALLISMVLVLTQKNQHSTLLMFLLSPIHIAYYLRGFWISHLTEHYGVPWPTTHSSTWTIA